MEYLLVWSISYVVDKAVKLNENMVDLIICARLGLRYFGLDLLRFC